MDPAGMDVAMAEAEPIHVLCGRFPLQGLTLEAGHSCLSRLPRKLPFVPLKYAGASVPESHASASGKLILQLPLLEFDFSTFSHLRPHSYINPLFCFPN